MIRRPLLWFLADDLDRLAGVGDVLELINRVRRLEKQVGMLDAEVPAARREAACAQLAVGELRQELAALQAIDVNFRDAGHVIVIARVGGRDIVRIIDVRPGWTMAEYKEFCREIEARFGAGVALADVPPGGPTTDWFSFKRVE